jgi:hypothetical protein
LHLLGVFKCVSHFWHQMYRVGDTCRVYRLHHSVVYNLLLPTPRVGGTIIPLQSILTPDVVCRRGLLMSSLFEGWLRTNLTSRRLITC